MALHSSTARPQWLRYRRIASIIPRLLSPMGNACKKCEVAWGQGCVPKGRYPGDVVDRRGL